MRNNLRLGTDLDLDLDLGHGHLAPAFAAVPLVPLQAESDIGQAVNAFLDAVAPLVIVAMALGTVILSAGFIAMLVMAGISALSEESGRQGSVRKYAKGALIALACALLISAGPEFLAGVGAPWPDQWTLSAGLEAI